jgi:hypothetical protein
LDYYWRIRLKGVNNALPRKDDNIVIADTTEGVREKAGNIK